MEPLTKMVVIAILLDCLRTVVMAVSIGVPVYALARLLVLAARDADE